MIGVIIAIVLILIWWNYRPNIIKKVSGRELVEFGLDRSDPKFIGTRTVGFTFRPKKNIVVSHVGIHNLDKVATLGVFRASDNKQILKTLVNDDHCIILGSSMSCTPIKEIILEKGVSYHLVMSSQSHPARFTSDFVMRDIEYLGKCWRIQSQWGPPTAFRDDGEIIIGPTLIYH